ncbi:hypothetical protein HU200_034395 [Digitaria exilis]|uniref:Peptidase A1 domain-containing protein n=1 Tax=Digitaria exilis TaxID=1010633 RepID=A0A835BI04_9POAL|nr:hypothetical protein HU200_034395 [Digitaria exilis]
MASSLAVLISLVACATLASGASGVRVELTRLHSSRLVRDAVRRDMYRRLAASGDTVSAPVSKGPSSSGEYLMTLAIGTPPLSYPAIADTGSDLIWTQCAPCTDQCFQQPTPLYNPASSTTFSTNNQTYNQTYGTGWTAGIFASETFTFGSSPADQTSVPGITFGCSLASSNDFNGSSGLVGLGRGSESLVTQLGAGKFSYCLTPFQDTTSTSTLLLGSSASLNDAGVGSTPFVTNPTMEPMNTYYYLDLTGISLDTTALSIPADAFALKADGTGGLIIDSGTTVTSLVDVAYQQVRAAVLSLVTTLPATDGSAATGLDLCFGPPSSTSPPPAMPSMTFHFNGADMVIPGDSYMVLDPDSGLWCLAMRSLTDGGPSILGNYQQQNIHILYDVGQQTLSFAPATCSTF